MKLEVKNIDLTYNEKQVLKNININVSDREFITVLGPSGCGKSTLLNIISGMLMPDAGEIYVDGEKVETLSSHFAYMPQQDLLLDWKTVMENACLYGKIHGNYKEMVKLGSANLVKFGLAGCENKYPSELSGGMRQRVAFLRTMLCKADIMLLDEPFGALDVITRSDMQEWLLSVRNTINKTTILVTHDIDEAIYLSDRILILRGEPATILKEIPIIQEVRTKEWLFDQHKLKSEIFSYLKGEL